MITWISFLTIIFVILSFYQSITFELFHFFSNCHTYDMNKNHEQIFLIFVFLLFHRFLWECTHYIDLFHTHFFHTQKFACSQRIQYFPTKSEFIVLTICRMRIVSLCVWHSFYLKLQKRKWDEQISMMIKYVLHGFGFVQISIFYMRSVLLQWQL